jgi:hypothetical protein
LPQRGQRKWALFIAGFDSKHLQLKQPGINLLTCQSDEIFEVIDPWWLAIRQHNPGLEQLLHRLLRRETPVFIGIGRIEAQPQAAQMAAHKRQKQQRVFSGRQRAPGPPGPHRLTRASGSR